VSGLRERKKTECKPDAALLFFLQTSKEAFFFPHLKLDFSLGVSDVLPDKLIELLLRIVVMSIVQTVAETGLCYLHQPQPLHAT
jgi:hypothetical protein